MIFSPCEVLKWPKGIFLVGKNNFFLHAEALVQGMDECLIRPWGFVGLVFLLAFAVAIGFAFAKPLTRLGENETWFGRELLG